MLNDFEQRYIAARGAVVDDISLFLVGQNVEDTQAFLQRWNDTLEADIHITPPTDKSLFIWKLIESVMARVRTIAAAAPSQQSRTIH